MNGLMTIKDVRGFIDEKGTARLNLEDIATGLGFTKTDRKDGKEYRRIDKQRIKEWLISFGVADSENELPEFIPENVFYKLAMKASNETARKFQDIVCDEILPNIRRHGIYATDSFIEKAIADPSFAIKTLQALQEERNLRLEAETKVLELSPKAEVYDQIMDSSGSIAIGDLAKVISSSVINPIGKIKLFKILRDRGAILQDNSPAQDMIERGFMTKKVSTFENLDGKRFINVQSRVTAKGIEYILKKLVDLGIVTLKLEGIVL